MSYSESPVFTRSFQLFLEQSHSTISKKSSIFTEHDFNICMDEDRTFEHMCPEYKNLKEPKSLSQPLMFMNHFESNSCLSLESKESKIPHDVNTAQRMAPGSPDIIWSCSTSRAKLMRPERVFKTQFNDTECQDPQKERIYSLSCPDMADIAFFTSTPPPQPAKINFQGQPPHGSHGGKRMNSLMENIQKIEILSEIGDWKTLTSRHKSLWSGEDTAMKSNHTGPTEKCTPLADSVVELSDRVDRMCNTSVNSSETGTSKAELQIERWTQITQSTSSNALMPRTSVACDCLTVSPRPSLCHIGVQVEVKSEPDMAETAYFTSTLPMQFEKLRLYGQPPDWSQGDKRVNSLTENMRKNEIFNETDFWKSFAMRVKAFGVADFGIGKKSIYAQPTENSKRLADCLIQELLERVEQTITSLEIFTSGSRSRMNKRTQVTQSLSSTMLRPRTSVACDCLSTCTSSTPSLCHIAVQVEDKKHSCGDPPPIVASVKGKEWIGGVRALRDLHVRLVLRQLRYIERMNHALEGVSRSCKFSNKKN